MIKFLLITFNAVLLFFFGLFSKVDGISISGNFPKNMKPGSEVPIEVRVKKGTMGGFAKLQLEMPEGFSATESDSKGANFSYADGIVKWVWPALPTEDEFVVKFNLKADAAMNGVKTIGGKFSYVENNAKQVVEMAPVEINVTNDENPVAENTSSASTTGTTGTASSPTAAASQASTTAPAETKTTEIAATTTTSANKETTAETPTAAPAGLNDEPPGNVVVKRAIKAGSNSNEHLIELTISKGNIKGFAKHADELPAGYTAKAVTTSESSFSVADGKIKFVWVNIPAKEEITISYLLSGTSNALVTIKGEFSFLANDQSKKFVMPEATLPNTPSAQQTAQATNTPTETPANTTKTETTTVAETKTPQETKSETNTTESNAKNASNVTAGTINYRVQIGAFNSSAVTAQRLSSKFGINDRIISEMHNSMNKFMIGSHNEYKDARDQREQVKTKVTSAFVVAYNGAKRITVQEALMLTNQKWFK